MFPRICECASRNNKFIIYGGDNETKDGAAHRDYIHMSDLELCKIRLMELLASILLIKRFNYQFWLWALEHCIVRS